VVDLCFRIKSILFIFLLFALFLFLPFPACARPSQNITAAQNTVVLWTDRSVLKAVTLVSITPGNRPISIISIPVLTRPDSNLPETLADLYTRSGRQALVTYLEKSLCIPIQKYFCIDQRALCLASEIIGPLNISGRKLTMVDVFEGTYAGEKFDLETGVQKLARKILEPDSLVKIPCLVWIFTTHVDTNLTPFNLFSFYQILRGEGPEILRKEKLPLESPAAVVPAAPGGRF
jgi:hypothetical protein